MRIIGITGGVGAGKSTVLTFLKEKYHAFVIQADEVGHIVMEPGEECYQPVINLFGKASLKSDKTIDRKYISDVVFGKPDMLAQLNGIIHPAVKRYILKALEEQKEKGCRLCIVEAALLPEVGKELCDELWYIYTDEAVRRERLKSSRHYTDEKITRMIASQPVEEVFRKACTVVIDNSGDFEATKRQIGDRLNK